MALREEDLRVEGVTDRPLSGMHHNGPNPSWVTVTHLPTMISATAYHRVQYRARQAALACVEMLVEESGVDSCHYPERVRENHGS
jgi:protein subunit release factor A